MKFAKEEIIQHKRDVYAIKKSSFTFGGFKSMFHPGRQSMKWFNECFNCGHKFNDEEYPYLAFSYGGNVFFCEECYNKYHEQINKTKEQ